MLEMVVHSIENYLAILQKMLPWQIKTRDCTHPADTSEVNFRLMLLFFQLLHSNSMFISIRTQITISHFMIHCCASCLLCKIVYKLFKLFYQTYLLFIIRSFNKGDSKNVVGNKANAFVKIINWLFWSWNLSKLYCNCIRKCLYQI